MLSKLLLACGCLLALPVSAAMPASAPLLIYGPELPPYIEPVAQGEPKGLMVDIVHEAGKRAGLNVRVAIMPWARGYLMVQKTARVGLIPTMRTPEREKLFRLSGQPIFRYVESWFKQKGARVPWDGNIASVARMRIVKMHEGLTAPPIDDALKSGLLSATETNSFDSGIRMVAEGHADLVPMPLMSGLALIRKAGLDDKVEPMEPEVFEQPVYLAFSRDAVNAELVRRLDQALKQMWLDGTIKNLSSHYY